MVIKVFECTECGKRVEVERKMNSTYEPRVVCKKKGTYCQLPQILVPSAIHFGTGFPGDEIRKKR